MNNIIKFKSKKQTCGKKIGTVTVSMYEDINSGHHFFYINADNEEVLQLSYIIEDCLYDF